MWGQPSPLRQTAAKAWREARSLVPGVAIQCPISCEATPVAPVTPQGKSLWAAGRLVMASIILGATRTLILNVYLPSGDLKDVQNQRHECLEQPLAEVETHWQLPMIVGGDWNLPPPKNFLATALAMRGWVIPLHVTPDGTRNDVTYLADGPGSCLDYWILSPSVPQTATQEVRPQPGHRHRTVSVSLPVLRDRQPRTMVIPPRKWEFSDAPLSRCSQVDWGGVHAQILRYLQNDQIALAWMLWEHSAHLDIADQALNSPGPPCSDDWYLTRTYSGRITKKGPESPKVAQLSILARRLLDFGKWGGDRVHMRLRRDLPEMCQRFGFSFTPEQALSEPLRASAAVHELSQELHQKERTQVIRKWNSSLTTQRMRPTPILYQWLRGGSPASASALVDSDGNVLNM